MTRPDGAGIRSAIAAATTRRLSDLVWCETTGSSTVRRPCSGPAGRAAVREAGNVGDAGPVSTTVRPACKIHLPDGSHVASKRPRSQPSSRSRSGQVVPARRQPSPGLAASGPTASWTTPGASPQRQRIETASRALLVRLHDLPRWVLFLAFTGLAIGGALLPAWAGAACLVALGGFLGWLLYLAWPTLGRSTRLLRLVVLGAVIAAAIARVAIG